jgi:serine/threonine protein kinase
MEKANLNDLSSFPINVEENFSKNVEENFSKNVEENSSKNVEEKKFYLINSPFKEICGDNIIRFLSKQIIEGLEKFDRSEYLHLDIKPGNILIFDNYELKLTDFSFLTKIDPNNKKGTVWGTKGYVTPEYYQHTNLSKDNLKKQDYFALGAVLYYLKYGEQMLDYEEFEDDTLNSVLLIELIQRKINHIKSSTTSDVDFNNFLCDLIQYKPEDRPSFEKIYRNKWLNKESDFKTVLFRSGIKDEGKKLLFELNKNDFLYQHKNEIAKTEKKKFIFKI